MIGTDLLNDLFTNNVDFVAKQMQTIIDALFPSNDDNSETDYTTEPILWTGQIKIWQGVFTDSWKEGYTLYNVHFNPYDNSNALNFIGFPDDANQDFVSNMTPYINQAYLFGNDSLSGLTTYNNNGYIRIKSNNNDVNFQWGAYFNQINDKNTIVQVNATSAHDINGSLYIAYDHGTLDFNQITDSKIFVITPDRTSAQTIYNNINYNNDYHTSYVYNDNGANIYVGGGAGGIVVSPMGMFNYGELKLAIDSLIDDLNLNFNNIDNTLPITEFPSYNDIKYEDMGSFYITPIQQIDTLPGAPDVGDTYPDFSDYLSIVGGAVNSFFNMVDGLGVSLMLVFTFLICLVINHLKKE